MPGPVLPLPTDDELTEEARRTLAALPPLNLFRMLAVLPASLRPFLELGGSILGGQHLTAQEREIAILRVAHATGAAYERQQHEQIGLAVGLDAGQVAATAAADPGAVLDADGALLCRAADEISGQVRLSDAALEAVLDRWGREGAAELILTVAFYNMASRFMESARVPLEEHALLEGTSPDDIIDRARAAEDTGDGA